LTNVKVTTLLKSTGSNKNINFCAYADAFILLQNLRLTCFFGGLGLHLYKKSIGLIAE